MPDFNRMQYHCEKASTVSKKLVDDFLLYLCAAEEGFEKKFAGMLVAYRNAIQELPEDWPLWAMTQYIAFQLFHKDGLAPKYLNHFKVRRRSDKELGYLKFQIEHPWRFVFCRIEQKPKECFFDMKDILTGENFLLYSQGIARTEEQQGSMSLYFLLIGFNGECWQTYGSLNYFKGIQPFDIFFFAKQLKPDLVLMNEIPKLIEEDPVPFMMLWVGGEFPLTFHKEDMFVLLGSGFKQEELDLKKFNKNFMVKKKPPVSMVSLKKWDEFPHFCKCFYNSETKIFSLNAMTDLGYAKLVETVNRSGFEFPEKPEVRVTPAMLTVVEKVLGRKIELNPYDRLFTDEPSPGTKEELDKMNVFLKKLMDAKNSGVDYDLRELAVMSGVEYETAKEIVEQVEKRFKLN